jgi:hypothetical protein
MKARLVYYAFHMDWKESITIEKRECFTISQPPRMINSLLFPAFEEERRYVFCRGRTG